MLFVYIKNWLIWLLPHINLVIIALTTVIEAHFNSKIYKLNLGVIIIENAN